MSSQRKTIAMLAANPALASIFSSALEDADCKVAVFSTMPALSTFLRIAPVDLAVLNIDVSWSEMLQIVNGLRSTPRTPNALIKAIVLTHARPFVGKLEGTGIDALLLKPVSPTRLVDAVTEILGDTQHSVANRPRHAPPRRALVRHAPLVAQRHNNVIPLFGNRQSP